MNWGNGGSSDSQECSKPDVASAGAVLGVPSTTPMIPNNNNNNNNSMIKDYITYSVGKEQPFLVDDRVLHFKMIPHFLLALQKIVEYMILCQT